MVRSSSSNDKPRCGGVKGLLRVEGLIYRLRAPVMVWEPDSDAKRRSGDVSDCRGRAGIAVL